MCLSQENQVSGNFGRWPGQARGTGGTSAVEALVSFSGFQESIKQTSGGN